MLQVKDIVVERDGLAGFLAAQHVVGKQLVLVKQLGEVLLGQCLRRIRRCNDRLHRQFSKAKIIGHMEQVFGKINVVMCKGAAHVVALAAACLDQLLELGHDAVIAAVAGQVYAEPVVDFLAPVERQHDVVAFFVAPVNDFVGDANAVGGHGEAEVFVVFFLDAACIRDELLAHLKVHQRFAAEEVDFQVTAGAAVLDQEIQRAFAGLKAHQPGLAVELALCGKAVAAIQVAGVGHVQAQCLNNIGTVFKVKRMVGVGVGRKQLPCGGQLFNVVKAIADVGGGDVGAVCVFLFQLGGGILAAQPLVDQCDGIVGNIVHSVYAAAVYVQYNVVAAEFILMNHLSAPLFVPFLIRKGT